MKVNITNHAVIRAKQRLRDQKRTLLNDMSPTTPWRTWLTEVVVQALSQAPPEEFTKSSRGIVRLKFHGIDLILVASNGGPTLVTVW